MPATPKEALDKHAKLTTEISNYIDHSIDSDQYIRLKNRLKSDLTPKARKDANDILDILNSLEKIGFMAPGKYDKLKQILLEFDHNLVRDVVEPIEEEIKLILSKHGSNQVTSSSEPDSSKTETAGPSEPPPKKRKTAEIAVSDFVKHIYEKTPEQKGLMLILNFSKTRGGSENDVDKLRELFQSTFKFHVECEPDLSKDGLKDTLTDVRDSYMKTARQAKQYYCFVCVVMSHGDEHGIRTNDGEHITMDEITSYFKNKETPGFLGKPKIFIVQACRGSSTQPVVESDDWSEDIDDYVGKMSVPHDADILIAYATTPGNKAFRTKYSDVGAWFIHVLLKIIEDSYEVDHFEDMLISVRHKIALDPKWRTSKYRQMPCSWTTLTKRFYLR